jgi:hypothetical protein
MSFHLFKRRHKHVKAEPLISSSVIQRKSNFGQRTLNSSKNEPSAQKQRDSQSMTTNQVDNINVPSVVKDVISSEGKALDTNTRASMGSHFGHDFSQVRVHTDAKAAESAEAVNARAYTVGNHIVFNTSEYKPDTLVGDALIGHEMAHVIQQTEKTSHAATESSTTLDSMSLEKAADSSAAGVIASILGGTRTIFGRVAQNVIPGFRTGLRLQRCERSQSMQVPSFFGPHSRETLETINRRVESGGALQQWIAFGQIITSFENPISALHTAEAAEAIAAVPVIVRSRIRQDIELLLVQNGNELNSDERLFWETMLGRL